MKKTLLSIVIIAALGVGSIASAQTPATSSKQMKPATTVTAPVAKKEEAKSRKVKHSKKCSKKHCKKMEEKQMVK